MPIIEYLVSELKVSVNHLDAQGISPLYMATYKGDIQIVKYLLERDADPWIKG